MAVNKWSKEELQFLKENYSNISTKELSKLLNRTEVAINIKANRVGLKKSKKKYNAHYFSNIDTEDKAYWLGFIYADGYINYNKEYANYELGIEISYSDKHHLEKLNTCMNSNVEISDRKRRLKSGNITHLCKIRFYNKSMVEDLIRLGVYQKKSKIITFPTFIPKKLMPHFIRGFIDGDGSVVCNFNGRHYKRVINVACSSYKFLNGLKNYLEKELDIKPYITKDGNGYKLEISNKKDISIMIDYLYKNATIYLERKYNKSIELLESMAV